MNQAASLGLRKIFPQTKLDFWGNRTRSKAPAIFRAKPSLPRHDPR
jgi:hypothetical protein